MAFQASSLEERQDVLFQTRTSLDLFAARQGRQSSKESRNQNPTKSRAMPSHDRYHLPLRSFVIITKFPTSPQPKSLVPGNPRRGENSPARSLPSTRSDLMRVVSYEKNRGDLRQAKSLIRAGALTWKSLGSFQCNSSSNGQTRCEAGTQSHGSDRSSARPFGPPGCRGMNLIESSRSTSANELVRSATHSRSITS
jgi:hypothetical protein